MEKNDTIMNEFKYFAFISYSSRDTKWGKRVQRKLESYRLPAELCSKHGWEKRPLKPVFFAPTDIQPGNLSEELKARLRASRNLIVICSPHSAQSEWVGKEIAYFHELGRTDQIHFFIVDGKPHSGDSETECFNPVIDTLRLPEILGANIHEQNYRRPWLNKERAYVQLISKLLGVEFDSIWNRHKRRLKQQIVGWTVGALAVLAVVAAVWLTSRSVPVRVCLQESTVKNDSLPALCDAVVTMALDNEMKVDTVRSFSAPVVFNNIPHHFLNKDIRMTVSAENYLPVDTVVVLSKSVTLDVHRNPDVFGRISFRLWDMTKGAVPGVELTIAGERVVTDGEGRVQLDIPLDRQRPSYQVTAPVPLASDRVIMPCGPDDVLVLR